MSVRTIHTTVGRANADRLSSEVGREQPRSIPEDGHAERHARHRCRRVRPAAATRPRSASLPRRQPGPPADIGGPARHVAPGGAQPRQLRVGRTGHGCVRHRGRRRVAVVGAGDGSGRSATGARAHVADLCGADVCAGGVHRECAAGSCPGGHRRRCGTGLPADESGTAGSLAGGVSDPAARRVAFALDATSVELLFVAGPLLLSALLVLTPPVVPLLVTAACMAVGGLLYCATEAPAVLSRRRR